ncbi:flagellar basal body rod protein FlgC [Candidatus Levibacter sp. Uisw_134_01]|uniref:flagellar basal body rod protein FlgC n=1 Tax=Candidatus Levibacter sp. Uisw_134_01 TaxID=3230999 RepID=UPI003D4366B3
MMDIKSVYDIAGRAMAAQLVRLNTVASNLANAGSTTGDPNTAYKPLKPVFKTEYSDLVKKNGVATVDAIQVKEIDRDPIKTYMPSHPAANKDGYIFKAPVNVDEEMVDMMEASRQYQNNVEVVTTLRALTMRTLQIGK